MQTQLNTTSSPDPEINIPFVYQVFDHMAGDCISQLYVIACSLDRDLELAMRVQCIVTDFCWQQE